MFFIWRMVFWSMNGLVHLLSCFLLATVCSLEVHLPSEHVVTSFIALWDYVLLVFMNCWSCQYCHFCGYVAFEDEEWVVWDKPLCDQTLVFKFTLNFLSDMSPFLMIFLHLCSLQICCNRYIINGSFQGIGVDRNDYLNTR